LSLRHQIFFRYCCRRIRFYTFKVKNHRTFYPNLPKSLMSQVLTFRSYLLLEGKLCRQPVGSLVEVYVKGGRSSVCPSLVALHQTLPQHFPALMKTEPDTKIWVLSFSLSLLLSFPFLTGTVSRDFISGFL
jgi:hypothetical protein